MKSVWFAILLIGLVLQSSDAQPSLEIRKLEVNYPNVRIHFRVKCDGVSASDMLRKYFEVYENGKLMTTAMLDCFEVVDCCMAALLVLDRSSSMSGEKFDNMKLGAKYFINAMNPEEPPCEKAGIVSFATTVMLEVPMTADKGALNAAVDRLKASGLTALWEATGVAIEELVKAAKDSCRAVIVLSDGVNSVNGSQTLETVVQLALANAVRVFTIGLGPGSDKNLPALSSRTGGKHYQSATGADLDSIYANIRTDILNVTTPECYLEYVSDCPDGTERVVEVKLKNFCGGTATQTVRYTAPYLPDQFERVTLRISEAEVQPDTAFLLHVNLESPVNRVFSKAYTTVTFDENLLEFIDVTTDGTLLAGASISFQRMGPAVLIRLEEDVELNTTGGILFKLHFRSKNPTSTVRTPVELFYWKFDGGCLAPVIQHGSVLIRAREPRLSCQATGPGTLRWSAQSKGYEPTLFDVSVLVSNSGDREIREVRATLVVDPAVVNLVNPMAFSQPLTPSSIVPAGSATARWTLELASYKGLRSFPVRFRIEVDTVLYGECEVLISLDSAGNPALSCRLAGIDALRWDALERRFEGNPFPVIIHVHNAGNITARNLRVTLSTDASAFRIVSPVSTVQMMSPATLPSGEDAVAQWTLEALGQEAGADVAILVTIESDNLPTITCERIIRIDAAVNPVLDCAILLPDSLDWNETLKRYEPNPFTISVTIRNNGSLDARNVRATLDADPGILRLLTPAANEQHTSPRDIPRGGTGTAQWTVEALAQSSAEPLSISVRIEADNHAAFSCIARLAVDSALTAGIACEITAPDTVYFRDQYYEPEVFDVGVLVRNTGSAATRGVRAQLLQDTRFTIVASGSQLLADLLPAGAVAYGSFRIRVHPRDTDGYDTIRVNVQGDDTNPAWCQYPIWVQRVRMPEFTLTCSTAIDSLVFNDTTGEYEPNPFVITTVATNIGETYAEECVIMLAAPSRFTPIGTNLRPEGTMLVGDRRIEQWSIRALARDVAAWDTLVFQVLGRGGLGRQIVITECNLPVYVPAVRQPGYELSCTSTDTVRYIDNSYHPDPLQFSMRIRNTGRSIRCGLNPTIILPPSVSLADGEIAERYVPALGIGESVQLTWNLKPELRSNDGGYRICAQVVDSIGITGQCCTEVFIMKSESPILMPSCFSVDTLHIDTQSGTYIGNPFDVVLNLTNVGRTTAVNVLASISILGSFMQIMGPSDQPIGDLAAGGSVRLTWRLQALKREIATDIPIVFSITAGNSEPTECRLTVHVPAMQSPVLQTSCSSTPEDSLFFDWTTGSFEHPICTLNFTVTNTSAVYAHNVSALLVLPSGLMLSTGEETLKPVQPSMLEPGASGTVTWNLTAMRANEGMCREFRFIARADNAEAAVCLDSLFIEGSPKHLTLSFPEYTLLRYRERHDIPIYIDRTIGKDLDEYVLQIHYDPAILNILAASSAGTLTGIGWVGPKFRTKSAGHIEITDYTTGTPLAREAGILLKLQVGSVYEETTNHMDYGESILHINSETSILNRGHISLGTSDGHVIATNHCLEPLVATEQYVLRQNSPNPFATTTAIEYMLPQDDYIRLVVFDRHGREVEVLAEGPSPKGTHVARFSGARLPTGLYFYRLESAGGIQTRKMLLTR